MVYTLYNGESCETGELGNAFHKHCNSDSNSGLSDFKAYSLKHYIAVTVKEKRFRNLN